MGYRQLQAQDGLHALGPAGKVEFDGARQAVPGGFTGPAASIDRLLSEAYPPGEPGAAVRVAKAGVVLLEKGYGFADVGRKLPATPETVCVPSDSLFMLPSPPRNTITC